MPEERVPETEGLRTYEADRSATVRMGGVWLDAVRFLERNQICDVNLWRVFVDLFRTGADDADGKWRCEYWGKMMRGAAMVLQSRSGCRDYTQSYRHLPDGGMEPRSEAGEDRLYLILEDTVRDLLSTADREGQITTYRANAFTGWDLWGRKYVMLGLEYFLGICRDEELKRQILSSLCRQADAILLRVGEGKGKIGICETSRHWFGMNSCSILEPFVRLYRLTGTRRYLDFASYIVSTGFCSAGNLIALAGENRVAPSAYPVTKAYEMMSCFEGLIQYAALTGERQYLTAAANFGSRILETELSVIGCCGCTHELFDHTAVRQTDNSYRGVRQETCVGVTWIKLASALLELTGDVRYADAIEQTFFNDYLGAMNRHRNLHLHIPEQDVPQVLPFDSYSPLTSDVRGKAVGGWCTLPGRAYYGCCACIGAAGAGAIPQVALLRAPNGFFFAFYTAGEFQTVTPAGRPICFRTETNYPVDGVLTLTVRPASPEPFSLSFRIPAWCRSYRLRADGKTVREEPGRVIAEGEWKPGDRIELVMEMPVERILPPAGAINGNRYAAYRRGPVVLAADRRISDPDAIFDVLCDETGIIDARPAACPEIPDCMECFSLPVRGGASVRLVDYASAGQTWEESSRMAAWIRRA